MTRMHEHNLASIDQLIWQAKQKRAQHIAAICGPALKTVSGFVLIVLILPWQAVRHTMTTLGS